MTMKGFKIEQSNNIVVDSGNTIPLISNAARLKRQRLSISATEELVNNGTSYSGQLIDSQKLQNLPNPGRNPFLFSKLDNNVTPWAILALYAFRIRAGPRQFRLRALP